MLIWSRRISGSTAKADKSLNKQATGHNFIDTHTNSTNNFLRGFRSNTHYNFTLQLEVIYPPASSPYRLHSAIPGSLICRNFSTNFVICSKQFAPDELFE
ncbi:hypothetical protein LSTR_LSTR003690 [Laodelphax striatellus]|uniref:Uncharacterized protein n=1 Tax=Laodelphax striatellus TaxID=195883 RepID=A0A482XAU7_LAOST|nr:hypothetical protein LSTR_LSTR003690 [Laodelphax striatellus]